MAVPGIDVAHLGHVDLSVSLGIPGDFDNPQMHDAIDKVAAAAARHGKSAGTVTGKAKDGREMMARGYRMMSYLFDTGILQRGLARGIEGLKSEGNKNG